MGNNSTQNSKLDETVKESLNNYEASYDAGDWARMEKMLDAAPKTVTGNLSYGKIAVIAGAVVLGSFLVYKVMNTSPSEKTQESTTSTPAETNTQPAVVTTPPVTTTTPANPAETTPSAGLSTNPPAIPAAGVTVPAMADKKKDPKKKTDNDAAEYNKNQRITVMGNEPIFGDMIDSSKGVIHKTKEKESTKEAAKTKGTAVGFSSLFQMNLDSIRKYNEAQKKDSLKDQ